MDANHDAGANDGAPDFPTVGSSLTRDLAETLGTDAMPTVELREPDPPADGAVRGAPRQGESRYSREGRIGQGGMGVVLRAYDHDLRRAIAMKVVRAGSPDAGARLGRFLEEAQVTAQLEHPGVVPVHELGVDPDKTVYFTMRLVHGWHFGEVIRKVQMGADAWTISRAVGVLVRICETMAFAHDRGVLHRDLKPANVMVGRYGEVYVMDWGLAKLEGGDAAADERLALTGTDPARVDAGERGERTRVGAVLGTPCYMPPEQAFGRIRDMDQRSDIYSVGAMLYHLLAGVPPFAERGEAAAPAELLERVRDEAPAPLAQLARDQPEELVAVCEKAMARTMASRYRNMTALADDLRAFLEGRVVGAHRTGAFAELRKWTGRNRLVAAALTVAVGVLIAALAATTLMYAREQRGLALAQERLDDLQEARWTTEEAELAAAEAESRRELAELKAQEKLLEAQAVEERVEAAEVRLLDKRREASLAEHRAGEAESRAEEARERAEEDRIKAERAREDLRLAQRERDEADAERLDAEMGQVEAEEGVSEAWQHIADLERELQLERQRIELLHAELAAQNTPGSPGLGQPKWEPLGDELGAGDLPVRVRDTRTGIVFRLVEAGSFTMGSPAGEGEADERPRREVTLESAFYMAEREITQTEWEEVMFYNPSLHLGGDRPVENVSWWEAASFCWRLGYLLPTEAEWEYACRADSSTPWWTGDSIDAGSAVLGRSAEDGTEVCGSLPPNAWGLHDVHGNVSEWCHDTYASDFYSIASGSDPVHEGERRSNRVARGGSYLSDDSRARSADRASHSPDFRSRTIGLRPIVPAGR